MISERWKQAEALFEQALEVPTAERPQFLQGIGDDELRREVESLLHAHEQAGAFLDEPDRFISTESLEENGENFLPGEIIDRYRIVREIGRGGMGAVFLAERADDQYQKQVAIKLIKRGTDTDSVLRHFRNERQILAGFDHPNIARLFDGGTTESGLPYFVMEYIEGLPDRRVLQRARALRRWTVEALPRSLRGRFLRPSSSRYSPRHQALEYFGHGGWRAQAARLRHCKNPSAGRRAAGDDDRDAADDARVRQPGAGARSAGDHGE